MTGCGTEIKHDDGWIHRLQSLIDNRNRGRKLQLLCVTKGLEPFANETINLSGAKKAGLYRMLQSEYKDIRSRHMDAEQTAEDPELANQIAEEFFRDSEDIEVCYRNGVRYYARLKETNSLAEKGFSFPKDHVLWITGGTRDSDIYSPGILPNVTESRNSCLPEKKQCLRKRSGMIMSNGIPRFPIK
nr:hypothetical protein [Bacillus velezensis]